MAENTWIKNRYHSGTDSKFMWPKQIKFPNVPWLPQIKKCQAVRHPFLPSLGSVNSIYHDWPTNPPLTYPPHRNTGLYNNSRPAKGNQWIISP